MALSESTIQTIQQAGHGLNAARQAVAFDVQTHAEQVVALVANQPFSPENDAAYKHLRTAARLAHDLQAMEEQLKAIYASAAELVDKRARVLIGLPGRVLATRAHAATKTNQAEDVIAKPQKPAKTKAKKKPIVDMTEMPKPVGGNDLKVLTFLKTVLDRRSWKPVTHAVIAQEAGIPQGSVGISLHRLMASNELREGPNKGTFRLTVADPKNKVG
jgi:hypothetical protein